MNRFLSLQVLVCFTWRLTSSATLWACLTLPSREPSCFLGTRACRMVLIMNYRKMIVSGFSISTVRKFLCNIYNLILVRREWRRKLIVFPSSPSIHNFILKHDIIQNFKKNCFLFKIFISRGFTGIVKEF